jgi:hypothetical protein
VKSNWSDSLESVGVPLITIKEWNLDELERVAKLKLSGFDPKKISYLWTDYWMREIANNY